MYKNAAHQIMLSSVQNLYFFICSDKMSILYFHSNHLGNKLAVQLFLKRVKNNTFNICKEMTRCFINQGYKSADVIKIR